MQREGAVILLSLALVVLLSSIYVVLGIGTGMSAVSMTMATGPAGSLVAGLDSGMQFQPWTLTTALLIFAMWLLMMVAMMVPSAAPTVLLCAALSRTAGGKTSPAPALFLVGYLVAWAAFSLGVTLLQWRLTLQGGLSPMFMALTSASAGGMLLIAAGTYQFTPLKQRCLAACRGPVQSLVQHWRPGASGAIRAGIALGFNCLGCCWVLMLLLFAGGVMNLYWIVGIAVFVAVEKLSPAGPRVAVYGGAVLIVAGVALILARLTGHLV